MTSQDKPDNSDPPNKELSPEEARKKREFHRELAKQRSREADERQAAAVDSADSTLATFILPGD